jgi:uncharacterized membrane protein YphA (DoxX/SURF4 family)
MKIVALIARVLLGLIFVMFGSNVFLHFLPMTTPPGLAGQFLTVLFVSKFVYMVSVFQLIGGLLLLVNRFVPLALCILGAIIVNILTFHILIAPEGLPLAIVVTVLWFIVFARVRKAFTPIFAARAEG